MDEEMLQLRFAVGSLTRPTSYFESANGVGISILQLDPCTLMFTVLSTTSGIDNPTYLAFDPSRSVLYAVSEVEGWNEGTVSAYQLNCGTAALAYLNKQPTRGSIAAHVCLDDHGRHLFVTNYSHEDALEVPRRAFAVYRINEDGRIAPPSGSAIHVGRGPSESRQRVPHPHCALAAHDGSMVAIADLGLDKVFHYRIERGGSCPDETPLEVTTLPPGSGPRHMVQDASGSTIYVVNELASNVAVLRKDPETGRWSVMQIAPTLPGNWVGENLCAAIQLSPDGRHLYCSNRGHDSIVSFAVEAVDGRLSHLAWTLSSGRTPRSFCFDSSGRYCLVANQNSGQVLLFLRDIASGRLDFTGSSIAIGTPMCVIAL